MLSVRDLSVHYGRVAAVQQVSLEVNAGELVGLVGPNGAGKTSTLQAIFGVNKAQGGSVLFEDAEILGRRPEDVARAGMSLVPEGRHIFGTLSVAENLRLGAVVRRGGDAGEAVEEVLERFPVLRKRYHESAGKLSGGEQQQLAIARALIGAPRLLLLDEPSLGLAPLMVDLVFEVLERLRADGMTILLVEQNAVRTIESADRTYVMRSGRIAAEGPREQFAEHDDLVSTYLGF